MSKEELMEAIKSCAGKLGRAPSLRELKRETGIGDRDVYRHFATYALALGECGLERVGSGAPAALRSLFEDWAPIARKLGKIPTVVEYQMHSRYSIQPLYTRFGSWKQAAVGLMVFADENGLAEEWEDVLDMVRRENSGTTRSRRQGWAAEPGGARQWEPAIDGKGTRTRAAQTRSAAKVLRDRPVYGPPTNTAPLAHGPVNEAGVVYLFGAMAARLGFVVTRIQTEFPDCEAMRRVDEERWQRVRIEFEYESRNFVRHLHSVDQCDVIVCWTHNWPECPLEVVELRSV